MSQLTSKQLFSYAENGHGGDKASLLQAIN
jgi:hypothetical protein